ncbi:hypothetical protein [Lunatimonas salinarum]|uniref:hypothetical protein n=1 Tax=Lunatimonas salinarum TaxID=1774590 RepID=UPI001AE0DD50|nr:hypothetical protein [Lunatimonas salinarum]
MSAFTATKNMKSRVKGDFHAQPVLTRQEFCGKVGVNWKSRTPFKNHKNSE